LGSPWPVNCAWDDEFDGLRHRLYRLAAGAWIGYDRHDQAEWTAKVKSNMKLRVAPYIIQSSQWPPEGRHILAQYDEEAIVVYQAYRQAIGQYAAEHGHFGGRFKLSRMSWIKPNFLWMMYRSAWGQKEGQEIVLAVHLRRSAFDTILAEAVHSTYDASHYENEETWDNAVARSNVRLQWDPDHGPSGTSLPRRAIQLGLRGDVLVKFAREWIIGIEDISDFVQEQRQHVISKDYSKLLVPTEEVYAVKDETIRQRLGLSTQE
jgi:hypothetical protein